MTDREIHDGDTERTTLVDMAADHAAAFYYRYKYPEVYRSTRYVNGHPVIVIMCDGLGDTQPIGERRSDT